MPTCCVTEVKSTFLAFAEKLLSWFLTSVVKKVKVDRVMSVFSKCCWISSVYCVCVSERERDKEKRANIINDDILLDNGQEFQTRHLKVIGNQKGIIRKLTLDTLSRSPRLTSSYKWSVDHRGWFFSQSL